MGDRANGSRTGVLLALAMLLVMTSASSMANAQDYEGTEGPGIDWTLPDSHMLYLKGTEEQPFLDRNWTHQHWATPRQGRVHKDQFGAQSEPHRHPIRSTDRVVQV